VEDLYTGENLDDQSIDIILNPDRIKWAINSLKPLKSLGLDGFLPAQLQRTLDISLPWLTAIFHGCLALNHIPTGWLDVKVLLSDAQHAYRKGRSTDTALHSLVFSIERGFRNKEYSLAAFLDIERAFNPNGYHWRSD